MTGTVLQSDPTSQKQLLAELRHQVELKRSKLPDQLRPRKSLDRIAVPPPHLDLAASQRVLSSSQFSPQREEVHEQFGGGNALGLRGRGSTSSTSSDQSAKTKHLCGAHFVVQKGFYSGYIRVYDWNLTSPFSLHPHSVDHRHPLHLREPRLRGRECDVPVLATEVSKSTTPIHTASSPRSRRSRSSTSRTSSRCRPGATCSRKWPWRCSPVRTRYV